MERNNNGERSNPPLAENASLFSNPRSPNFQSPNSEFGIEVNGQRFSVMPLAEERDSSEEDAPQKEHLQITQKLCESENIPEDEDCLALPPHELTMHIL